MFHPTTLSHSSNAKELAAMFNNKLVGLFNSIPTPVSNTPISSLSALDELEFAETANFAYEGYESTAYNQF